MDQRQSFQLIHGRIPEDCHLGRMQTAARRMILRNEDLHDHMKCLFYKRLESNRGEFERLDHRLAAAAVPRASLQIQGVAPKMLAKVSGIA